MKKVSFFRNILIKYLCKYTNITLRNQTVILCQYFMDAATQAHLKEAIISYLSLTRILPKCICNYSERPPNTN